MGFETITKKSRVSSRFQIMASNYLDVAYFEYYYPEKYDEASINEL